MHKEMETHPSIVAWKISWTEESGGFTPWSHKESDKTEQLTHIVTSEEMVEITVITDSFMRNR